MKSPRLSSTEELAVASRRLTGAMLALIAVGIVMVWSASAMRQLRGDGDELALLVPLASHLKKVLIALLAFLIVLRLPVHWVYRAAWPAWGLGVALLLGVLLFGEVRNGSRRWFDFGGVSFQPSEWARLATILMISAWMAASRDRVAELRRGVLLPFALAGLPAVLVFLEPDFGSAVYLLFMGVVVMWVGGARSRHLLAFFLPTMALICTAAWMFLGHFRDRITSFLGAGADDQVRQALTTLGSGGLLGSGLASGRGSWGFLPEAEDDFLFAVIGEELGLLGTAGLIALYACFLWQGVRLVVGLRSRFAFVAGTGLLLQVGVQAVLNIAVVTKLAPNKGLPLPFLSAGGTSLLILCVSTGLLLGLARRPEDDPVVDARWAASLTHRGEPGP